MANTKHGYFWISMPIDDLTPTLLTKIKQDIITLSPTTANPEIFLMVRTEKNITNARATVLNNATAVVIGGNSYDRSGSKGTPPGGNNS